MTALSQWLDELGQAASDAATAEQSYRNDFARRVAELADARAVAFRRANLMRALAESVSKVEDGQAAVAHGLAVLRTRLGWSSDSEARTEILSRFAPVCEAAFRAVGASPEANACFETAATQPPQHDAGSGIHPARDAEERPVGTRLEARTTDAQPNPAAALADFETWYLAAKGTPFWKLFENVMPETPLVDW